jgi:deoxycytidine triphosphate deaminase
VSLELVPGVLSDTDIRLAIQAGELVIDDFAEESLTPVGYDLRIGDIGWILTRTGAMRKTIPVRSAPGRVGQGFALSPGQTALILSREELRMLSPSLAATIHSKVSLVSQGFSHVSTTVDPRWGDKRGGLLLIQISNQGPIPLELYRGEPFATVVFYRTISPATKPNDKPGSRDDIVSGVIPELIERRRARSPPYVLAFALRRAFLPLLMSATLGFPIMVAILYSLSQLTLHLSVEVLLTSSIVGGFALTALLLQFIKEAWPY